MEEIKEQEIKTLEDLEPIQEEPKEKSVEDYQKELEDIIKERDSLKDKYSKALEENNRLFQRLTSTPVEQESALNSILSKF